MPRRSRAREVVLQVLYRFDLNPDRDPEDDKAFVRKRLHNKEDLVKFAMSLLYGVMRNRSELDEALGEFAENWSLQRMAVTDRNVLRIGAYEILLTDTPPRVAINEAVDLARRFGTRQSSQFVNGVLDHLLQDRRPQDRGEQH